MLDHSRFRDGGAGHVLVVLDVLVLVTGRLRLPVVILQDLAGALPAEEVLGPYAAHALRIDLAHRPPARMVLTDEFPNGRHGRVTAGIFDVAAGHTGSDSSDVVDIEVLPVDLAALEDKL